VRAARCRVGEVEGMGTVHPPVQGKKALTKNRCRGSSRGESGTVVGVEYSPRRSLRSSKSGKTCSSRWRSVSGTTAKAGKPVRRSMSHLRRPHPNSVKTQSGHATASCSSCTTTRLHRSPSTARMSSRAKLSPGGANGLCHRTKALCVLSMVLSLPRPQIRHLTPCL